jgi:hormone-sensitive lipase
MVNIIHKIALCPIEYVKIKILHNSEIHIPTLRSSLWFNCCVSKVNQTRNSIIIHIHGGGFIAMSSSTHENYLRKWTKTLGVPIFSIDYRLAPEYPYPKSLDDVWQAYNWIIENASQELDINLDKIILVGDSAGGNLVLGLVYLLIVMKKRIPDCLFLAYPGCRVNLEYFHPSYLLTLQDKILPFHFIKFCLDCYTGDYDGKEEDPFLNPVLMDKQVRKINLN